MILTDIVEIHEDVRNTELVELYRLILSKIVFTSVVAAHTKKNIQNEQLRILEQIRTHLH